MALTKAYCIEAFDRTMTAYEDMGSIPPSLNVFVDDIAISVEGSFLEVVNKMTDAFDVLRAEIEGPLSCKIETDKAAVVASSQKNWLTPSGHGSVDMLGQLTVMDEVVGWHRIWGSTSRRGSAGVGRDPGPREE